MSEDTPRRTYLRDLPFSARLVLAVFLASVGFGYFSAIVQLHFQDARAGELLPSGADAVEKFHGTDGASEIERLLTADESRPFNGSGSMRSAFFARSSGWKSQVRKKKTAMESNGRKVTTGEATAALRKDREREIAALMIWLKDGAKKSNFEALALPKDFFSELPKPPENDYFYKKENGDLVANASAIFTDRCARCHNQDAPGAAGQVHLDSYEGIALYCDSEGAGGIALGKLAQTTHVHLLGFSMLYGLTGLILAFSSYPGWLKLVLCPLPLAAQVVDISFWWLARVDPVYAHMIPITGGVVALSLGLQIILSLFNLFGIAGKILLAVLIGVGGGTAPLMLKHVIEPHLQSERVGVVAPSGE
jgi:hypothetical protein